MVQIAEGFRPAPAWKAQRRLTVRPDAAPLHRKNVCRPGERKILREKLCYKKEELQKSGRRAEGLPEAEPFTAVVWPKLVFGPGGQGGCRDLPTGRSDGWAGRQVRSCPAGIRPGPIGEQVPVRPTGRPLLANGGSSESGRAVPLWGGGSKSLRVRGKNTYKALPYRSLPSVHRSVRLCRYRHGPADGCDGGRACCCVNAGQSLLRMKKGGLARNVARTTTGTSMPLITSRNLA